MTKAYLFVDIQNDYFQGGKYALYEAERAVIHAKEVLDKARLNNEFIVHVQHISLSPHATFFLPDTEGVKFHPLMSPANGEVLIKKNYPNAFRETELLHVLKTKGVEELIVCGMMTHMCIDTTVRAAFDQGFKIKLVAQATATRDLMVEGNLVSALDVQNAFLASLNGIFCELIF